MVRILKLLISLILLTVNLTNELNAQVRKYDVILEQAIQLQKEGKCDKAIIEAEKVTKAKSPEPTKSQRLKAQKIIDGCGCEADKYLKQAENSLSYGNHEGAVGEAVKVLGLPCAKVRQKEKAREIIDAVAQEKLNEAERALIAKDYEKAKSIAREVSQMPYVSDNLRNRANEIEKIEPPKLTVNGRTSMFEVELVADGGRDWFKVDNFGRYFIVDGHPNWFTIEKKEGGFYLNYDLDTLSPREFTIWVRAEDGQQLGIRLHQDVYVYITVDGYTDLSKQIEYSGGTLSFKVSTTAKNYEIIGEGDWCQVMKGSRGFSVRVRPNDQERERKATLRVRAEEEEARVVITQKGAPPSLLQQGRWRDNMDDVKQSTGDYKSVVERVKGYDKWLGIMFMTQGTVYVGEYILHLGQYKTEGKGMLIQSTNINRIGECDNCQYYVGEIGEGSKMSGRGKCYDKRGRLIYDGQLNNDKPIGGYPSQAVAVGYLFECIEYPDGSIYIGETFDGKRHGMGILLNEKNNKGDFWYGEWRDDQRNGYGLQISNNGEKKKTGLWKNDVKQ